MANQKPDIEINKPAKIPFWRRPWFSFLLYGLFVLVSYSTFKTEQEEIPYSQFLRYVQAGQVQQAVIRKDMIEGTLKPEKKHKGKKTEKPRQFVTVPLWDDPLAVMLEKHGVNYVVRTGGDWLSNLLFNWILPFAVISFLWIWIGRKVNRGGSFLSLGGNRVRIHPNTLPKVTFDDVAGVEEAKEELREIIVFLRDPSLIQDLGGRMPKGVLLAGPPGTGKTLLARAVAGEARVPFFNISGSEFIELFVGVGAARARDLFEQARKKAPCIIFIDELDAIGRTRAGAVSMGGHDEREQTLNQLLVEMDGFDPSVGVVVMAATNRAEILDKALLRAGRFDRRVLVDKPDLEGRIEILKIHVRALKLGQDVDLKVVAQRTPGFVGADLANIANEAALHGVRMGHEAITLGDFEAAVDRVIAGPEKKHQILSPEEKRRVAYHESGHTLVAETVPTGEPVHKVSIIPRGGGALGYTLQLPVKEKFLANASELKDQLAILLGGRSAEEIVYGDVSSGAQNDLEKATEIAHGMVCQLGMNEKLGPLTYGKRHQSLYLGVDYGEEKNYSEATAQVIDAEVKKLIEEAHQRAREILTEQRQILEILAELLEEKEIISGNEVKQVIDNARGALDKTPFRK
ncbi:membrane protease FtsH catalytic subunit [Nitrosococcus oceani ATCC 19707]|uniref:ATP-dependent zinc metalloprotease FtsH n=2 Tax=Nitrosococcus oceani TaxID=1229 RepID=Q3J9X9_NITOC|nr:ATP-dependent zinc metalloprotease FtsH [Nitrosococcus oceani]ABA58367.1 membrane protease FtsH catalytic subunit [Nitrosococcus oceani ATCC 19707]EDZ68520.1 ATP-dependent metallopeptidase HflB subfamily [Nitrosococcus oceani AFC27]KFI19173.1 cell division protein FtsH [Nitrosococcus oceani C-27]